MKKSTLHNTSIFIISMAAGYYLKASIAFFSISGWQAFTLMIAAMAGPGAAAAAIAYLFLENAINRDPERFLWRLSFSLYPVIAISYFLQRILPFNPAVFPADKIQYLWLILHFILNSAPVFIASLYLVISLKYYKGYHALSYLGTTGTAAGIIFAFVLGFFMEPRYLIVPSLVISFLASLAALFNPRKRYPGMVVGLKEILICSGILLAVMVPYFLFEPEITEPVPKPEITTAPEPSVIYALKPDSEVLCFGSKWESALKEIQQKYRAEISIAEPDVLKSAAIQKKRFNFQQSSDSLWAGLAAIKTGTARTAASHFKKSFDIIDITCYDYSGHKYSAGQQLKPADTFTAESVTAYLGKLKTGGFLTITVWDQEEPPRTVPRLILTLAEALRDTGCNPGGCLYIYASPGKTLVTLLAKKGNITEYEYDQLKQAAEAQDSVVLFPAEPVRGRPDFVQINEGYYSVFLRENNMDADRSAEAGRETLYTDLAGLAAQNRQELAYSDYIFNIRPVTEDSPYFSSFIRFSSLPQLSDKSGLFPEEWDTFLAIATLVLLLVLGALLILIPVFADIRLGVKKENRSFVFYFLFLGLGGAAVFQLTVSLFSQFVSFREFTAPVLQMLVFMLFGMGGIYAGKWKNLAERKNLYISLIVVFLLVLFAFFLFPLLNALYFIPLLARIIISLILLGPVPFCSGALLPTGLESLGHNHPDFLPWAFGSYVSAFATGISLTAILLSATGFRFVLLAAALLFTAAGFFYRKTAQLLLHQK